MSVAAPSAVAHALFLYAIAPLWIAAGITDWYCHRRTAIEATSGAPESLLHVVMLAQVGIPALAVVFFEMTSLVVALVMAGLLAHTVTTYIDLRYSHPRREIGPLEQMVHCLLAVLPLLAACLVVIFSWPAVLALVGAPGGDWGLHLRAEPVLDTGWALAVGAAALAVGALNTEELWRTTQRGPRAVAVPAILSE